MLYVIELKRKNTQPAYAEIKEYANSIKELEYIVKGIKNENNVDNINNCDIVKISKYRKSDGVTFDITDRFIKKINNETIEPTEPTEPTATTATTETTENLYWFTDDNANNVINDFYGTYSEAENYAQQFANALNIEITINCGDDITGFVYPDEPTETIETTETLVITDEKGNTYTVYEMFETIENIKMYDIKSFKVGSGLTSIIIRAIGNEIICLILWDNFHDIIIDYVEFFSDDYKNLFKKWLPYIV